MKFQYYFVFLLMLIGCKASDMAKGKQERAELFSISGRPVYTDEFIYVYRKNNINNDSAYTRKDVDTYLDLYINFKLKIAEALNRGMDTTAAFKREFAAYNEQLKKPYLTENKVTEKLLEEAYQRYQQEINAAHILIRLEKNASPSDTLEAYQQILDIREKALGNADFSKLARQYSEDPSAKVNSGKLGYFTSFQMVYPFETAAYNTPVGQISMPVRTEFGYHLIKVIDKRPSQGRVQVSHLMLRPKEGTDSVKLRNQIFGIYDQAVGGVAWEDLVRQFSEDINTRNSGGLLRPFSVGQMPYTFQEAAFALKEPGAISDPVQTPYGWHILRLEKKLPQQSYTELESSMRAKISRDQRAQLGTQALIERLKKENGFVETEATDQMLDYADSTLMTGTWSYDHEHPFMQMTLFKVADKSYTVSDFFNFLQGSTGKDATTPEAYMQRQYNKYTHECIIAYEESHLAAKYIDYRMLVKEYREGILLFELMEEEIWGRAANDTAGLKKFYNDHISRYQWERRAQASVFGSSRDNILSELEQMIINGDSIALSKKALENRYNHKTPLTLQIEQGIFERGAHQIIDQIEMKPGLFKTESNGKHYLVWIKKVLPAGPKDFSEVKGLVTSDYQDYLDGNWLARLRKKYPVDINKNGLNYVYEVLEK